MLKFLVQDGIATLHSSTVVPTECRMVAKAPAKLHTNEPTVEEGIKVAIHPENNLDIFAWRPADMTRVLRSIVEHRLNVYEGCPPIRQKKRGQAPDPTGGQGLQEADWEKFREERMFLGHIVNMKGIKACPKKAEAVIKLQSPRTLKEVQSLNGKLACLNRGGKGVPINKAIHHRTANANSTKTIRRTDNVPLRSQGNG
ncbi:hypothetical protein Tco_0798421 [Tanacetum coccineum]